MTSLHSTRTIRRGLGAITAAVVLMAPLMAATVASARAEGKNADGAATIRSPGFLLADGRYRSLEVPGSKTHIYAYGINDRGLIAGGFDDPSVDGPDGRIHGSIRQKSGRFASFDVPDSIETQALGINNRGVVVGEYVDADGVFHGFRWRRGRLTTVDGPGSLPGAVTDINDHGEMVGAYFDDDGTVRGFLLSKGVYTTFDVPYGPLDLPTDINNRAQIVGSTLSDQTGTESHGFVLRKGVGGPFTRVDFPGTTQTIARGIDDRGRIVGLYGNPDFAPTAQRAAMGATGVASDSTPRLLPQILGLGS